MSDVHLLARARKSFEQHTWADSYRLFEAADHEAPLEPEDLERLAAAAYLLGREDESEAFWERAHRTFLERGDRALLSISRRPVNEPRKRSERIGDTNVLWTTARKRAHAVDMNATYAVRAPEAGEQLADSLACAAKCRRLARVTVP